MKNSLRAIIFDLDDTLLVDEEVSQEALQTVAVSIGIVSPREQEDFAGKVRAIAKREWRAGPCYPFCHAIGISAMECLWGNFWQVGSEELCHLHAWAWEYREKVFQQVLREQTGKLSHLEKKEKECVSLFEQERRGRQRLFPEVMALLERLKPHYLLGLLTNGAPTLQREKIGASGLEHFFSAIIISGEYGIGKPKPAIFEKMKQQLKVTSSEVIMIGNSLERDIAGAQASKIRSVWVDLGTEEKQEQIHPDFRIKKIDELLPILSI